MISTKYYLVTNDSIISIDRCEVLTSFPFIHPDEDDIGCAKAADLELWRSLSEGSTVVVAANDAVEALELSKKYRGALHNLDTIYCMKCDCHHRAVGSSIW